MLYIQLSRMTVHKSKERLMFFPKEKKRREMKRNGSGYKNAWFERVNKHININAKRLSHFACLTNNYIRNAAFSIEFDVHYYKNHVYCLLTMTNIYHIFRLIYGIIMK